MPDPSSATAHKLYWSESPIQFECKVARVELFASSRNDDQLEWNVSFLEADIEDPRLSEYIGLIPTGHLAAARNGSWGQALVVGQVIVRRELLDMYSDVQIVQGFVEQMWDTARRALTSLVSQLDAGDLELPVGSSDVTPTRIAVPPKLPEDVDSPGAANQPRS